MRGVIQWNKAQQAFLLRSKFETTPNKNENESEVKSPRGNSSPRKQEKKSTTRNIKNDEQQGPANV